VGDRLVICPQAEMGVHLRDGIRSA
jgi:hypothetical protein